MALDAAPEEACGIQPSTFVDESRRLQDGLARYFNKPLFFDIAVIAPDGRKLLCHQVVLSAGSKRFANMLEQGNLQQDELPVWGVDSDALQCIIEFFYSGECLLAFPGAVAIVDAATRLDVPNLAAAADAYVRSALSPATLCSVLSGAVQYKLTDLAAACVALAGERFDEVAGSDDWRTGLSLDGLTRLLAALRGKEEEAEGARVPAEALFRGVARWLAADMTRAAQLPGLRELLTPVPDSVRAGELVTEAQRQQGADAEAATAAAMALTAAVTAPSPSPPPQQQQEQQVHAGSSSSPGRQVPRIKAEAGADDGKQQGSSGPQSGVTGSGGQQGGQDASPHGTSQPQGTLSSFDPHHAPSALPTPTSRAMAAGGALDGSGAFGAGGGDAAAAAMAAAAAAAAGGGMAEYMAMFAGSGGSEDAAAALLAAGGNGALSPDAAAKLAAGWAAMGYLPGMHQMQQLGAGGTMQQHAQQGGGAGSGGSGSGGNARNHAKGVCQVEGCNMDLRGLRDYHLRYKICETHLKISSIMRDGVPQRFCQQCGRFHHLTDFDGTKRSCRSRLQRHNARRRKRGEEEAAGAGWAGAGASGSSLKRGRGSSSHISDMDHAAAAAAGWGAAMDPYGMAAAMMQASYAAADPAAFNTMLQYHQQQGLLSPTGAALPGGLASPTDAAAAAAAVAVAASPAGVDDAAAAAAAAAGGNDAPGAAGTQQYAGGLAMLADVAQARSSAAGDASQGGAAPGAAAPAPQQAPDASEPQQQQQQQASPDAAQAQQAAGTPMAPLQLANASASPSPHAAGGTGRLFAGRVSPGHDAAPTGADAAAGSGAGKQPDLAFRADKGAGAAAAAAAGTVKG